MSERERIVAAAIFNGCIFTLPPPARHHTILRVMPEKLGLEAGVRNQGFNTSSGRFVTREEAFDIAYVSGQCKEPQHQTQLFSEDLW